MSDLTIFRFIMLATIPVLHVCCCCAKSFVTKLVQDTSDDWFIKHGKDEKLITMLDLDNQLREQEFNLLTTNIQMLWTGLVCLLNLISLFL